MRLILSFWGLVFAIFSLDSSWALDDEAPKELEEIMAHDFTQRLQPVIRDFLTKQTLDPYPAFHLQTKVILDHQPQDIIKAIEPALGIKKIDLTIDLQFLPNNRALDVELRRFILQYLRSPKTTAQIDPILIATHIPIKVRIRTTVPQHPTRKTSPAHSTTLFLLAVLLGFCAKKLRHQKANKTVTQQPSHLQKPNPSQQPKHESLNIPLINQHNNKHHRKTPLATQPVVTPPLLVEEVSLESSATELAPPPNSWCNFKPSLKDAFLSNAASQEPGTAHLHPSRGSWCMDALMEASFSEINEEFQKMPFDQVLSLMEHLPYHYRVALLQRVQLHPALYERLTRNLSALC